MARMRLTDGPPRFSSLLVPVFPSWALRRPDSQPTRCLQFLPTAFSRCLLIASAPSSRWRSKLRNIDPALCLAAGITDVHQLSAGLVDAGVLVPYGSDRTALRLHDLFVARVEESSSDPYDETWLSWAHRICELLEERGRISEALELSLKLNDVSRATAIVRNHGFSLWGSLHADLISRTIALYQRWQALAANRSR